MARRHPCPRCTKEMLLEPVHEGFEVPCPACGERFLVPPGAGTEPAPPPSAPPPMPEPKRAHVDDGTTLMVLTIVVLALGALCSPVWLAGPVCLWFAHRLRKQWKDAKLEPPGAVTAAWVMGIVMTCLVCLGLIVGAVIVIVMIAAGK